MLFVVIPVFSFGQKDLIGVYESDSGYYLEINRDSLTLSEPDSPGMPGLTLAECTFEWVDDNFIEINSTPPYLLIRERMTISEFTESNASDSLKISLSFPNYLSSFYRDDGQFKVSLSTNLGYSKGKHYELYVDYSNISCVFMLPRDTKSINVSITNPIYNKGTLYGLCYGFLNCPIFFESDIKNGMNEIKFDLPAVDVSFFRKYYVKNEYAKVDSKTITWKGEIYTKKKR